MPFLAPIGFALGVGGAATATAAATGVLAASIVGGAVVAGTGLAIGTTIAGQRQQKKAQARGREAQEAAIRRSEEAQKKIATAEATAATGAREKTRRIARRRTKTILTEPGAFAPPTAQKTLLGQ